MARGPSLARPLRWLRESCSPVFVIDARRQVTLFNRGCERKTGWPEAELLGLRADFITESDPHTAAAVAAALAPPPEVWQGTPILAGIALPHQTEPPQPRQIQFLPLLDDENKVLAVVGWIQSVPATENLQPTTLLPSLHAELAALRHRLRRDYGERTLVARCPAMMRLLAQIKLAQASLTPVLILGGAGTGKEHIARVLHYGSANGRQPFVPVDCHTTSSIDLKRILRVLTERSDDAVAPGALYLSSIDAAPADVQERLTVALSAASLPGMRIIGSSQRPLEELVADDRLRPELYFRLSPLTLTVPALHERGDDLPLLAQMFLEEHNRNADPQVSGCSDEVLDQFRRYAWPGNLEELKAVLAEARAACTGTSILAQHLPFRFRTGVAAQRSVSAVRPSLLPLDQLLERVEREQIEQALIEAKHVVAKAAELLDIPRARLYRRMQQLGISGDESSPH